jgi:hypothetical protein
MSADRKDAGNEQNDAGKAAIRPKVRTERTGIFDSAGTAEKTRSQRMERGHVGRLQGAILEGKLNHRQIGQLAYTIQLAAWNVTRTSVMVKQLTADEEE